MSDAFTKLLNDFDRGRISRRQLMQALGAAALIRPASALAQGSCGPNSPNFGTPLCDTTPGKAPFAPTGWKTVLLDHFTMQVADVEKEAAYFQALMNWNIRTYNGGVAVLDIGDWGGLWIRGGYQPPAPATPPATPPAAAGGAAGAAGAAGGGGRGGGRGTPRMAVFDSFCWGIEPWNARTVEAELKKRGLNPVADNVGKDFESFHIQDADGFHLQISNGNSRNRRQTAATGRVPAAAPFERTNWKTVWLDHISFETTNYKEQAAFYNALLGWELGQDEGSQNTVKIGDIGGAIIRRGGGGGGGRGAAAGAAPAAPPPRRANIGHISFGIQPWDTDTVNAELTKRGLSARVDTGGNGSTVEAMRTAKYQSYHTTTPNGFDLQISFVTKANRDA